MLAVRAIEHGGVLAVSQIANEVAAAVQLKEPVSEADLLAFCKERLADFKRPKKIHITDAIPRTATGKIQRRVVAQYYAEQAQQA